MKPTATEFTRATVTALHDQVRRDAESFATLAASVAKTLSVKGPKAAAEAHASCVAMSNLAVMGGRLQKDFGRLTALYTLLSDLESLESYGEGA